MATNESPSSSEYVGHHLLHMNNSSEMQTTLFDITFINLDTVFWGLFTGLLSVFILWLAARRATSGVPNRFQAAIEIIVEMVEDQSKSIVHGNREFIAPLALTVFLWVFFYERPRFIAS
jgi:F-type H+-transporting ATPase subunit a